MKIVYGQTSKTLGSNLQKRLGIDRINLEVGKFENGEKRIRILDSVKGDEILLLQTISPPVDEKIIETLLIVDAAERSGVKSIELIIPWMGYSLQNKQFRKGEPLSAAVIANLFKQKIIKKITFLDIHKKVILNYFKKNTLNKSAVPLFAKFIQNNFITDSYIVTSVDKGGLPMAKKLAKILGLQAVSTKKVRNLNSGSIERVEVSSQVKGKNIFLIDDGILSGKTIYNVAKAIHEKGGKSIHCFVTHAIFTKESIKILEKSDIDSLTVTNSVYHRTYPKNCRVIDCSLLFV